MRLSHASLQLCVHSLERQRAVRRTKVITDIEKRMLRSIIRLLDPFYYQCLTYSMAWISNSTHGLNVITKPYHNFNVGLINQLI